MKPWEEYQHQAAGLLSELGFNTEVNARLTEANGAVHAVDVAARRTVAGVDLLWIVECKLWKSRVPIEKVDALRSRVINLGADRGLLMSESGFQSGAIRTAIQKNITLTSLDDLRANAADEILAARVALAEKSLMDLSARVSTNLRPSGYQVPLMLATFAARLPPEAVEEFAARPSALLYGDGMILMQQRIEGLTAEDHAPFRIQPDEWELTWRRGVDPEAAEDVARVIHFTSQGMYQYRLGQWPAACHSAGSVSRLAWSAAQLIDAVESVLPELDRRVAELEAQAADHS